MWEVVIFGVQKRSELRQSMTQVLLSHFRIFTHRQSFILRLERTLHDELNTIVSGGNSG